MKHKNPDYNGYPPIYSYYKDGKLFKSGNK